MPQLKEMSQSAIDASLQAAREMEALRVQNSKANEASQLKDSAELEKELEKQKKYGLSLDEAEKAINSTQEYMKSVVNEGIGMDAGNNPKEVEGYQVATILRGGSEPKIMQKSAIAGKSYNSKAGFKDVRNSVREVSQKVYNTAGALQPMVTGEFIDPDVVEQTTTQWEDINQCFGSGLRASGLNLLYLKKYREVISSKKPYSYFVAPSGDSPINNIDVAFDSLDLKCYFFQSQISYTPLQLATTGGAGVQNLVGKKTRAAARVAELAFQQTMAMGNPLDPNSRGLLNQSGVSVDTTSIPTTTALMDNTQFTTMVNKMAGYIGNQMSLGAKLDTLVLPYFEIAAMTATYIAIGSTPLAKTRLQYLIDSLTALNPAFKMYMCPYADQTYNTEFSTPTNQLAKNIWVLYNKKYIMGGETFPFTQVGFMSDNGNNFNAVNTTAFTDVLITNPKAAVYFTNINS